MALLVVACVAVVAGYGMLLRQAKRGSGSGPFLLSALPIAALLLIAPVPAVAMQTMAFFKAFGATTHANVNAGALALGIVRPLWFGSFGFMIALGAAGVIQVLGMDDSEQVNESPPGVGARKPAWQAWILIASPLLIVPTGLLIHLTAGIASVLMQARAEWSEPQHLVAATELTRVTQALAARLILGALGGFGMLFVGLVFAVASIVAHRFSTKSDALVRISRGVMALVAVFCVWNLAVLTLAVRAIAP